MNPCPAANPSMAPPKAMIRPKTRTPIIERVMPPRKTRKMATYFFSRLMKIISSQARLMITKKATAKVLNNSGREIPGSVIRDIPTVEIPAARTRTNREKNTNREAACLFFSI